MDMSDDKIKTAARAALTQYMSQHKLRKTPERFAILDKVFGMASHFSIDTLHYELERDGYHVSRATVYNAMELLIRAGLVRRNSFANTSPQYEKVTSLTMHYHLICTSCGKIREVKDAEIDALLQSRRFGKFQPAFVDVNIYGLCPYCQRTGRKKTEKPLKNKTIK